MATEKELEKDNIRDTHWLGEIVDNKDPRNLGRCKVKVYGKFDLLETESIPWATAMNRDFVGSHHVPRVGDIVAVRFDNGNIYHPEYWFQINQNIRASPFPIVPRFWDQMPANYLQWYSILPPKYPDFQRFFGKVLYLPIE